LGMQRRPVPAELPEAAIEELRELARLHTAGGRDGRSR
jgi:hypothetical protein